MSKPTPVMDEKKIASKLTVSHAITLLTYAGLLVLYTLTNLLAEHGTIGKWLISCIPLLIFIPGFIRNHYKIYSWLCFVVLIYFTAIVPPLMAAPGYALYWLELVLILVLFIAAMMTSRWRQQQMYLLSLK